MNIVLPSGLFYGVGLLLVLFGGLRAYVLGWKVRRQEEARLLDTREADRAAVPGTAAAAEDEGDAEPLPPANTAASGERGPRHMFDEEDAGLASKASSKRAAGARRHLIYGVVWVVMGLFLIGSTLYQSGRP